MKKLKITVDSKGEVSVDAEISHLDLDGLPAEASAPFATVCPPELDIDWGGATARSARSSPAAASSAATAAAHRAFGA